MAGIKVEWAIGELDEFLRLTELHRPAATPGIVNLTAHLYTRGPQAPMVEQAQVVEQILDRVLPRWRVDVPSDDNKTVNRWIQHREAAQRAQAVLRRQDEVRANLGDDAPDLSAASMHSWVWDGARSLWSTGHYRDAVGAAGKRVNAEMQNKVGRTDIQDSTLVQSAFSPKAGSAAEPRLRVPPNDGTPTAESIQRGAHLLAQGWFSAVRNPVAHVEGELTEAEALEQLAALSMVARWADAATVER
ncbi:hypothetical protein ASG36_14650 [Geodermatophilus sp. Leaf369]|uniref:TIGR02391 family protein n=1 Tax=Geodermatophilus sp. Leaf369 TaxID=1736354 RepID=UPI0006F4E5FE|nr:TIGR02391 family protein [Geodermatophilus sp. Leaf369]KQS57828.1 hypothetical protein ASG36_14650 [Geodermatophilus sp. Leaf369]